MITPIIIAEAGVNHNGNLDNALQMVEIAKQAGADYIKFQTFKADSLVTPEGKTADYQKNNCDADSQLEMLRNLELSFDDFKTIALYCKELEIGFLSTPFDKESINFLASLGVDFMKIPSGEITNLPYLRAVALTGIPAIISTGMSTNDDIANALDVFFKAGYTSEKLTLLHCTTEYPTPMTDVNLKAMVSMREMFGIPTGYSDHTPGIEIPVAATALGAVVIEKHFTLSRTLPGPDHAASLEPNELAKMINSIRNVSVALGSGEKHVTESERKNQSIARKSIVAARDIKAGEVFNEDNITTKRPATGLSPMLWDEVIGRTADKDFPKNSLITL
ncbi:MAG: N-acetylneuraminate synthase [Muribaculaceae bacterium]|nr:N-acetylneuraminate synthase [Muribaculaceae bacterium]